MITSFILGIVFGLAVGVLVTIRQYEKHLKAINEQLKKANTGLGQANAMTFTLTAEIKALGLENQQLKSKLDGANAATRDTFPA